MHGLRPLMLAVAAVASGRLASQTASPGYAVATRYQTSGGLPSITAMARSGDDRTLWVAHRHILYAVDATGVPALVYAFAPTEWIGAVAVDPGDDSVWFTNFGTDTLYQHEPLPQRTRAVMNVPRNTFDLAFVPRTGVLLVTANPLWPQPGANTGIWHVDLVAGRLREVVQLAGPSGPLAFDADDNLLYATQSNVSPPPPASSDILRWPQAGLAVALAGGPPLTLRDATLVVRGFDAAFDLAVDARARCYVSDGWRGQVWRADLTTGAREATPFVHTGAAGTTHLAWRHGPGPAVFAPFQPHGGGTLLVAVDDYAQQRAAAVVVAATRPTIDVWPSNPLPRGPARLIVAGAAPSAPCLLLISPLPLVPERSVALLLGAPLWLGLDPGAPWLVSPLVADATGQATWSFVHAFAGGTSLSLQALTLDLAAGAGTSAPEALGLSR